MSRLTLHKVNGLKGKVLLPGDKSLSHRAVIFGTLAKGKSVFRNFLRADDCMRTLSACQSLGMDISLRGPVLTIHGKGFSALQEPKQIIDAGNSGTTLRLMTGFFSAASFFSVLTGDASLRRRPMRRVTGPLRAMGAGIWGREGGDRAPLAIQGGSLRGMFHELPVASAQVKSALLIAGLHASGATTVREPLKSRDHSERMLRLFGAEVEEAGTTVSVRGGQELHGISMNIPGDISSAAFIVVAALITKNSDVVLRNVLLNPGRTGFIEILKEMGGAIEVQDKSHAGKEPSGDIHVRSSSLHGTKVSGEIILRSIDEIPALCAAASAADGETIIRDAEELRVKESDRIGTMASELKKFGVKVEEFKDGLRIQGGRRLRGARCTSHGDHRVAMALSVLGLAVPGRTIVEDTDCIETSFPGFSSILHKLVRS